YWQCVKCTLVNQQSRKSCKLCGGSRLNSVQGNRTDTLASLLFSWTCTVCTLRNTQSDPNCVACNNPRTLVNRGESKSQDLVRDQSGNTRTRRDLTRHNRSHWECSSCTYLNESSRFSCEVCHQARS